MPLPEERRAQLDGIVGKMEAAGESDDEIRAVVTDFRAKYESAGPVAPPPAADQPSMLSRAASGIGDFYQGRAKQMADTVVGLGEGVHRMGNAAANLVRSGLGQQSLPPDTAAFDAAREMIPAVENAAERYGAESEKLGEFALVPPPVKGAGLAGLAATAGLNSTLTMAQGGGPRAAAVSGALSVAPYGAVVGAVGRKLKDIAPAMVRSGVKPTVAALKKMSGKPGEALEARATRMAEFILEKGLATPQQAFALMRDSANATRRALSLKNAPTDAAERAMVYLKNLEKALGRQPMPAPQVAAVRAAAREMLEGPMGRDVTKVIGVDDAGNAITEVVREARTDIMADEALEIARGANKNALSSQAYAMAEAPVKAGTKALKEVVRALRTSAKEAVPEIVESQANYGRAKEAFGVLDRMTQRQGNREAVSLPAGILAANGQMILAAAANWLRNNQVRVGHKAYHLAKAIEKGSANEALFHLRRLGASIPSMTTGEPARASVSGRVR